jgi:hypothetical protein
MTTATKSIGYTLRLSSCQQLQTLKALHRATYPEHGLSFNQWAIARLMGQDLRDKIFQALGTLRQAADALSQNPPDARAATGRLNQATSILLAVTHELGGQAYGAAPEEAQMSFWDNSSWERKFNSRGGTRLRGWPGAQPK